MDFIEGIGQSYLQRKAYAVPQQLENLAKKQFTGGDAAAAAAGAAKPDSAPQNGEKDMEIEKLRRELAETKQSRGKPAVEKEVADDGKGKEIERLRREIAETKRSKGKPEKENIVSDGKALANKKAKAFQASQSPEKSKSTSKQPTKSASKSHSHAKQQDAMHERQAAEAAEAASRRGRSSSAKTATAAKKPALDFQKQHHKTEKNHQSHSKDNKHPNTAPTPQYPPALPSGTQIHRVETVQKVTSSSMPARSRPAADICLVEVIDEEPPRRERRAKRSSPAMEVVEKDRYRTRYVIR